MYRKVIPEWIAISWVVFRCCRGGHQSSFAGWFLSTAIALFFPYLPTPTFRVVEVTVVQYREMLC